MLSEAEQSMPVRTRSRKWSIDRRTKQSYSFVIQMLYNQILRSRRILLILGLFMILFIVKHLYSDTTTDEFENTNIQPSDRTIQEKKINAKVVEINDRQPSFKLYVYDGYEVALDRYRAQAKLLDNIKLHDKCQQNSKTIVVDVGASLGQFGLYAAACGCHVYMFEDNPLKLSLLRMSIKLNSFESRVTLIPKAVSDLPSNTQLFFDLKSSSHIPQDKGNHSSDVYSAESINLNTMNFSSEIYLFHVDVPGYEIHVFRASEKLFRENIMHHVLFRYTPAATNRVMQNDLLGYMRDILGGKRFYALHPKQAGIYGPLYNEDIDQFYAEHQPINLDRDVYVLFQDEDINIDSKSYDFKSSYN